jgi:hypothetical protein
MYSLRKIHFVWLKWIQLFHNNKYLEEASNMLCTCTVLYLVQINQIGKLKESAEEKPVCNLLCNVSALPWRRRDIVYPLWEHMGSEIESSFWIYNRKASDVAAARAFLQSM